MRKILIYFILLLPVLGVLSCSKNEKQSSAVDFQPVTEGDIEVSWEGGIYTFEYSLKNATESLVEPFCEVDWISDWRTGEYGKVSFTVAENPTESDRTADVRLDYEDQSIEFKVRQGGRTIEGNSYFRIEFSDVTTTSYKAKVTPADMGMTYIVMSSDMESMAGFEDDQLLFEDAIGYYRDMASRYGMNLAGVMEQFLITGEYEDGISNLEPGTEYCLFVIGVSVQNNDATMLAPIARASVTTRTVEMVDIKLTIDVETEYTGNGKARADVSITSDNTEVRYFTALLTQTDYDIYGASMPEAAERYLKYIINSNTINGLSLKDIYDIYTTKGTYRNSFTCDAKYYYWMTAFAVDESMNIISEVVYERFQASGLNSDNKIALEMKDVTATTARIASTTTNDDPYWVGVATKASLYDWDDEYLMWAFVDYYDIASYVMTGSQPDLLFENLNPDTEYSALAFGFDDGSYTTGLTRMEFKTGGAGDPSECTFDIRLSNLKSRGVDVTVVPSDPSVSYHWDMFEGDMTEEEIKDLFQKNIEAQIAAGVVSSALEYWQYTVVRGTDSYGWATLTPDSEYQVIAVAIDMEVGDYAGDFVVKTFSTPQAVLSDAEVELDSKYYDGDALYEENPAEFASCAGKALLDVRATVSGSVQHYYYNVYIYKEGNENPDVFTEEDVIHNLVDGQGNTQIDKEYARWLLDWNREYILIGIAVDADGNYGRSFRQKICPTKDGVSPVEDYSLLPAPFYEAGLQRVSQDVVAVPNSLYKNEYINK